MEKNADQFSMQEAMRLAQSDAGKQLLALLKKENGAALQQAAQQFRAGNAEAAQETLRPLLQDTETAQLLHKLNSKGR